MGVRIYGATSGYVDIEVPDVADNGTVTLSPSAVSPGLVLIRKQSFAGATSVSLDNVFSSTYRNYQIRVVHTPSASGYMQFRMRAAGVDNSAASYGQQMVYGSAATMAGARETAQTLSRVSQHLASELNTVSFDLHAPAVASFTKFDSRGNYGSAASQWLFMYSGTHAVATAYDGITLSTDVGTFTGDVYVYGYAETVGDYPQLNQVPGLSLITTQSFSAASTVSVNNCFTSEYDNYRIVIDGLASASGYMQIRFRASGADNTASTYASTAVLQRMIGAGGLVGNVGGYTSSGLVGYFGAASGQASIDVTSPRLAAVTKYCGDGSGLVSASEGYGGSTVGVFNNTTSFDGFTIYPASGTITGSLSVYGYRKA